MNLLGIDKRTFSSLKVPETFAHGPYLTIHTLQMLLQEEHIVVEVLWNLPPKIILFRFIAEFHSRGRWLEFFVDVF